MKSISVILFSILISINAIAQEQESSGLTHISLQQLKSYNDSIFKGSTDSVKLKYNQLFKEAFRKYLAFPENTNNSLDSIRALTKSYSDDGRVSLFTWMIQTDSFNTYTNNGFIKYISKKGQPPLIFELHETKDTASRPVNKTFTSADWYGALYYKIIEVQYKKESYFVLLGWKGNNQRSTIKVIETLHFKDGIPIFGKRVIEFNKSLQNRIIFEFNSQAVMMLRYDEKMKMILFDHLSPADGLLNGNYETYGPDFSIDALKPEKGILKYYKDIDLRSSESKDPPGEKKKKELYKPLE